MTDHKMSDPTYVLAEINANPEWKLAWQLSEVDNDNAPVGWGRYIILTRWLLTTYDLKERSADASTESTDGKWFKTPSGRTVRTDR
jgi:hypothetical protein